MTGYRLPMTDLAPHGLHHVTAIASDPQRNADFHTAGDTVRGTE